MKLSIQKKLLTGLLATVLPIATLSAQATETVTLEPVKDTSIFSEGELSNGQGNYLFVGRTNRGALRRTLISFDLSGLPGNAAIQEASLSLNMNKSRADAEVIALHRLTADWGEGASDAAGSEGTGVAAENGDATWTLRISPGSAWTTAGGDVIETASATTSVGSNGAYSWEGDGVVADVQSWIDDASLNFGWILVGNETSNRSAKRFDSRHSNVTDARPTLTISYVIREEAPNWAGYPISDDGSSVNTEAFIGWIDVSQAPWIYSYSLGKYIYLPEENVGTAGGWAFVPK